MKGSCLLFFYLFIQAVNGYGQIVYFENFGTGCTTGTLATTFGWTNTNTGTNEATANVWYVSSDENGVGPGNCGVGCGGDESRTLHVGAAIDAGGDLGAAYFESSAFICGFLGLCSATSKRIESPTINCTGISSITFSFDYIENGEGTSDNATVWYSANNGTTWTQIDDPPKTSLCGAQGLWTTRTLTLPASADNNPTVKIGFRWVNNANGTATDPSFAVDNIQVGLPVLLSAEMLDMEVYCTNTSEPVIYWKTQSELNAAYYAVYKSTDGTDWKLLNTVTAKNSSGINTYTLADTDRNNGITYYYLEQVDMDGTRKSYPILSSEACFPETEVKLYPNPSDGHEITLSSDYEIIQAELFSIDGKLIAAYVNEADSESMKINPDLPAGRYLVRVLTAHQSEVLPLVVAPANSGSVH